MLYLGTKIYQSGIIGGGTHSRPFRNKPGLRGPGSTTPRSHHAGIRRGFAVMGSGKRRRAERRHSAKKSDSRAIESPATDGRLEATGLPIAAACTTRKSAATAVSIRVLRPLRSRFTSTTAHPLLRVVPAHTRRRIRLKPAGSSSVEVAIIFPGRRYYTTDILDDLYVVDLGGTVLRAAGLVALCTNGLCPSLIA
jgi:hypothetical protein